jgi:hypothetical protein
VCVFVCLFVCLCFMSADWRDKKGDWGRNDLKEVNKIEVKERERSDGRGLGGGR